MKKIISISVSLLLFVSMTVTSFAAPKVMPDGQIFDAEYYAAQNPDVVKAMGTDEAALYQHYTMFGIKEGRLPYAPGTEKNVSAQPAAANTKKSSGKKSSSFYAAGDENYLRASYLSQYGSYTIGVKDEWGEGDPALGFVRQDYTADPFYAALKNDIIAGVAASPRTYAIEIYSTSTCRINNESDSKYYKNLVDNLHVDLMKSGKIDNATFMIIPADGDLHLDMYGLDYGVYAILNINALDKSDIKAHPEIKKYYNKACLSGY